MSSRLENRRTTKEIIPVESAFINAIATLENFYIGRKNHKGNLRKIFEGNFKISLKFPRIFLRFPNVFCICGRNFFKTR